MNKLKPCPFCAGEGYTAKETYIHTKKIRTELGGEFRVACPPVNDGWLIECKECGARGPHEYTKPIQSREKAVFAWNRREGGTE